MHFCDYNSDFVAPHTGVAFHYFNSNYNDIHTHNYWEIFLLTDGKLTHTINSKNIILKERDMYIIRPKDVHCFYQIGNTQSNHINFMITPEKLKNLLSPIFPEMYDFLLNYQGDLCLHLDDFQYSSFQNIIEQLYVNNKPLKNEAIIKLFILDAIKLAYFSFYQQNVMSSSSIIVPDWLTDLINRINSRQYMALPLSEIYKDIPFSPVHINRLFKQYMQTTLGAYFIDIKLKYSCKLLEYSNFTILDICSQLGYSSLSHFNHIFKKKYGCTPTEWRKNAPQKLSDPSTQK